MRVEAWSHPPCLPGSKHTSQTCPVALPPTSGDSSQAAWGSEDVPRHEPPRDLLRPSPRLCFPTPVQKEAERLPASARQQSSRSQHQLPELPRTISPALPREPALPLLPG